MLIPPPPKMFSKAFQFTMRYGHTHWRDLWLVVLGTPPAPLLPFHFWSRSRFTCSKKITCDRISSSKKKKERITMFHFSSIRNLSYLKYIFMMYLNKHTIIKENGDQVIKSMLTVHSVLFCSDVNLWDCKFFNYDLTIYIPSISSASASLPSTFRPLSSATLYLKYLCAWLASSYKNLQ